MNYAALAAMALLLTGTAFGADDDDMQNMSYLDNGEIRLGVDLSVGGAITYLADSKTGENVINNFDWGRQIQMSFYAGPHPYHPEGTEINDYWSFLGWNPIQVGDAFGNRSKLLDHKNDGTTLYVKCIPMVWPLNNVPGECTFESWITLDGHTVHARAQINNARTDKTQYPGTGQECPAVFTNGPLYRVVSYKGDRPFTGDRLSWDELAPTDTIPESWVARVNKDGWGIGVWCPGVYQFQTNFWGADMPLGTGGTKDNPTGYMSPVHFDILDHDITYSYEYTVIMGTLEEIRNYVYEHADQKAKLPEYVFANDRQHWYYNDMTDTGWPVKGELNIRLNDSTDALMFGPREFWPANDVPKLYVRAAFKTPTDSAWVFWQRYGDKSYSPDFSHEFKIIPDGEYHTYEVDLSKVPLYTGSITGIGLKPALTGGPDTWVKIDYISYRKLR